MKLLPALLRQRLHHFACGSFIYDMSLGHDVPEGLVVALRALWPGQADTGRALCAAVPEPFWQAACYDGDVAAAPHDFSWLADLRALGGDPARRQARELISVWIRRHGHWSAREWAPALTGRRLYHWIAFYDFFGATADDAFLDDFFESMMRQARHLQRSMPGELRGMDFLHALRGLLFCQLALPGQEAGLAATLDHLETLIKKLVLADGTFITRNPEDGLRALQTLLDVREALKTAQYPVSGSLDGAIERLAQALRFFRYADRRLAVFHGANEGDAALIDTVLSQSGTRGKILRNLPQGGYERLTLGRSVLMMDTGQPPSWPHDESAHAAPLAFEFLYGRERIFVSCGMHSHDAQWQALLRGTAAHNALSIDQRNACEIRDDGHMGRAPRHVIATRRDGEQECFIEAAHDGYVPLNGITHRRSLYLGRQGHDLRGQEELTCAVGLSRPVMTALRFHLHPKIQVSPIREGKEALLRLPGGSGWRFMASGGWFAIEDSIYLGETPAAARKTKQLVIYAPMETDSLTLKWALQRQGASA